jgi:hypothetical protein
LEHKVADRFTKDGDNWLDESGERAGVRRALIHQAQRIGAIYAQFDVGGQFKERRLSFGLSSAPTSSSLRPPLGLPRCAGNRRQMARTLRFLLNVVKIGQGLLLRLLTQINKCGVNFDIFLSNLRAAAHRRHFGWGGALEES